MAKKKQVSPHGSQSTNPKWLIFVGWGISLAIAGVGWWLTFKQLRRAEANAVPELELKYEFPSLESADKKIVVRATGSVGVKDIWLQEKAFLLTSNQVFDAPAIPTLRYLIYNGSVERMFDLQPGDQISFDREQLQDRVCAQLTHVLGGQVVLLWHAQYRREADGRLFTQDWFFTGTPQHFELNLVPIYEAIGGGQLLKRIQEYLASGSPRYVVYPPDGTEPRQVRALDQPWYRLRNGRWKPWEEYDGTDDFVAYRWLEPYLDITAPSKQDKISVRQAWIEKNDRILTAIIPVQPPDAGRSSTDVLHEVTMNLVIWRTYPKNFPLSKYRELGPYPNAERVPDCTKELHSKVYYEDTSVFFPSLSD